MDHKRNNHIHIYIYILFFSCERLHDAVSRLRELSKFLRSNLLLQALEQFSETGNPLSAFLALLIVQRAGR